MRSVFHAVIRWISAVFTGIECILRIGDWPSLYGVVASQVWLVVTALLVAPEIGALMSGRTRLGELSEATVERIRYCASVTCVGLSGYLLYLTGGGDPPPGEHF